MGTSLEELLGGGQRGEVGSWPSQATEPARGAAGCRARKKGSGGQVNKQPRLPGTGTEGVLSPYLLQHPSGKLQLVQLLLVCSCDLSVGLCQALLLERPRGGGGRAGSATAVAPAELVCGDTEPHRVCPISPAPGCSPAGEPLGVSWGLTRPGWSPGSSDRCLPATHSPEQEGKNNRLLVSGGR